MTCPPTDPRIGAELPQLPHILSGIVAAIGLTDAALHIELRLHMRRWHILDIGVRPGSGLVAHAAAAHTGVDPRMVHLAASIGRPLHPAAVTAARGRHAATCIACCYVAPQRRTDITLLRHSELADQLYGSDDVLGWHLNAAETDDRLYRPDAGISVGIGAPDRPTALARLRSLVEPFDFTTQTRDDTKLLSPNERTPVLTLHHLALTTADQAKAAPFYDAVFGILGYSRGYTSDRLCTWGGPGPELLLYIVEGDDAAPHTHGRPGWQHGAFSVDDRATVDAVHTAVLDGGWTVVHGGRGASARNVPVAPHYAVFQK
ncbi:VOC family protein [Nocardia fusca]|uniref:VOC family protein n=1 Tax=Nocardia fusca TaxID=941183 RepID=UPI0007A7387A|nr:VOC family protein [Nocardia fusca]